MNSCVIKYQGGPLHGQAFPVEVADLKEQITVGGAVAAHIGRELVYRRAHQTEGNAEIYRFEQERQYEISCGSMGCSICDPR